MKLSVIVITKNEEDRIIDCLKSVADIADEIIIFDSGSTDRTVELCKQFTPNVYVTDWPGFGKQKQRALEKATGDWVLSIDADERLTPELASEIKQTLNNNPKEIGFRMQWAVIAFGTQLNYGRSARFVRRLFVRKGAKFSDAIVHEKILLPEGKVSKLKNRLLHYSVRDFEHYMAKNRQYAWLGAKKRYAKGVHGGGLWGAAFRSVWVFFLIFILRRGFLDGSVGFLIAVMYSQSAFNKYAALWTMRREAKNQLKSKIS